MRWDQVSNKENNFNSEGLRRLKQALDQEQNGKPYKFDIMVSSGAIKNGKLALGNQIGQILLYSINEEGFLIKLFETKSSQEKYSQTEGILSLDFNHDGTLLVGGCVNSSIKTWKIDTNNTVSLLKVYKAHTHTINCVKFNSKGDTLASCGMDSSIKLWKVVKDELEEQQFISKAHEGPVNKIAFNPSGDFLASASADCKIKIWKISNGKAEISQTLKGHNSIVSVVTFNHDGTMMASGSMDCSIAIWDIKNGEVKLRKSQPCHQAPIFTLDFNKDGTMLASGSADKKVAIWKFQGDLMGISEILESHQNAIGQVLFNESGSALVSLSADKTMRVWNVGTQVNILNQSLKGHTELTTEICFNPQGTILASGSLDGTVKLWKIQGYQESSLLETLKDHKSMIQSVSFNYDGSLLATGSADFKIIVYRVDGLKIEQFQILTEHKQFVSKVRFSQNGQLMASSSADDTVKLWKITSDKISCIQTLEDHTSAVQTVCFHPDSTLLATGSSDNTIKLWKIEEDRATLSQNIASHIDWVMALEFNKDGTILASSSGDKTIKLWQIINQKASLQQVLEDHNQVVSNIKFNHDSTLLISGSADSSLKFWKFDECTATLSQTIDQHFGPISPMCFNHDSSILASGTGNNDVQLLHLGIDCFQTIDFNFAKYANEMVIKNFDAVTVKKFLDHYSIIYSQFKVLMEKLSLSLFANPILFAQKSGSKSVLKFALETFEYQAIYYHGKNRCLDPLYAALNSSDDEMLSVWIEYLEDHPESIPPLTSDLFELIFRKSSSNFQKFALSLFFDESTPIKMDKPDKMRIDPEDEYSVIEDEGYPLTRAIVENMQKNSPSGMEAQTCTLRSSKIKFNLSLTDSLVFKLLIAAQKSPTLQESVTLRAIIDTVFQKASYYFFAYSALNILTVCLFSYSSIWEALDLYVIIPMISINIIMLLYEIGVFIQGPSRFIQDNWNWVDLLIYPLMTIVTIFHLIFGYEYQKEWYTNIFLFLSLAIIYTRSITMLRAIGKARYLIAMILQVFSDITVFLIVLCIVIIICANMQILTRKVVEGEEFEGTFLAWIKVIDGQYNYGYGNWDGSDSFQPLLYTLYLFSGIFTGLVMFNILIAIVSKTFDDFTERQGAINTKEQLYMLMDLGSFMRLILCKNMRKSVTKGKFIHIGEVRKNLEIEDLIENLESVNII